MTARPCGVARCDREYRARGFCGLHYKRWMATGDPLLTLWVTRREDHFWSRVDAGGDCWEWTGYRDGKGYGRAWWDSRNGLVHRISYELLVGPIPAELQLDHLCRNRACVNPDHLEPVTCRENIRRGSVAVRKQTCERGHPLFGDNLYVYPNSGRRGCRTCRQAYQRRWGESRGLRKERGAA